MMSWKKDRLCLLPAALIFALISSASAEAQVTSSDSCAKRGCVKVIDLSVGHNDSADVVKGPVTLKLININRVRYEVKVGVKVELSDGPDLSLVGFLPTLKVDIQSPQPAEMVEGAEPAATETTEKVGKRIVAIQKQLAEESGQVAKLVERAGGSTAALNQRLRSIVRLLQSSDQELSLEKGAASLGKEVEETIMGIDGDLKNNPWPSSATIGARRKSLDALVRELADLPIAEPTFSSWVQELPNFRRYEELREKAADLRDVLAAIAPGSENQKGFAELVETLRGWRRVLSGLASEKAFEQEIDVSCGFPFFKAKTFKFEIVRVDRTATDKSKAKSTEPLVTVECPSSFSISGGLGVSGTEERDYAFVSVPNGDGTGVETRIGIENESSEQINPLFLINTRVARLGKSGAYNFHVSAGTVLDFDNPDSKTRLGYILGGSFSLKDNLFMTVGIQAIRAAELAPGVDTSKPVPMGLEKPPLVRNWDTSWVFAVSYKLR